MPNYSYQAITENGAVTTGSVEAETADAAAAILMDRGLIPSKINERKAVDKRGGLPDLIDRLHSVKTQDLILFTKQFRSLFKAGVPIIRSFQVLEAQTQDRQLKRAIESISDSIKQGSTLFAALEKHDRIFSPLYRNMIKAGEMSGTMPESLERLIYIIEHEEKIKSDIKSALQYPMMVTIALTAAFFILETFVVPKFVEMFSKSGIALPGPTKIAIFIYHVLSQYWYLLLGGAFVLFGGLKFYLKTDQGKYTRDFLILRIPVIGPLFVKAAMSRFASIFGILQSSGVPVMTSMKVLSGVIGNRAIAKEFEVVREKMQEGHGIAAPLRSAKFFTPMVVDMVAIGEETGNMEEMLREVTTHYDDEVGYTVKRLSDLIGPILVVGLAAVVGFFALAIFLPMWDLTKMAR
jgi:type II secretory pathway component PulF